jgi:hypothetical protein
MTVATTARFGFVLTDTERNTLLDILEEVLKETAVELRRTEAFAARKVVRTKEATIQALLRKVHDASPVEEHVVALASRRG